MAPKYVEFVDELPQDRHRQDPQDRPALTPDRDCSTHIDPGEHCMDDIKAASARFIEDNFIMGADGVDVRATATRSWSTTSSTRPASSN